MSQQFHPAPTSHRLYVRSLQPCCNPPISQYRMTPGSIGTMPRCEPRTEETERHVSHEFFAPHVALMSVVIASLDFSVSIVSDAFAGKVSETVRIHAFDMWFKSSLDDHATSSDDLCRAVRRICGRTARTLPQDQDCSGDCQCRSEVVARFIPRVSDQSYVLVGTVNTSFALTDSDTAFFLNAHLKLLNVAHPRSTVDFVRLHESQHLDAPDPRHNYFSDATEVHRVALLTGVRSRRPGQLDDILVSRLWDLRRLSQDAPQLWVKNRTLMGMKWLRFLFHLRIPARANSNAFSCFTWTSNVQICLHYGPCRETDFRIGILGPW